MSAAFVLDCSVAMTWCFHDEATDATRELLLRLDEETALVPSFWFLEVANVLALAEKKKRIDFGRSIDFIDDLLSLNIETDPFNHTAAFSDILPLSRHYGLTTYDALYLELASREDIPLATLDKKLAAAAKREHVQLLC